MIPSAINNPAPVTLLVVIFTVQTFSLFHKIRLKDMKNAYKGISKLNKAPANSVK
jgi:hypothetical protein